MDVLNTKCTVCGQTTQFCCSSCFATFYCCEQHQLEDWHSRHKFSCKPALQQRTETEQNDSVEATEDLSVLRAKASECLQHSQFVSAVTYAQRCYDISSRAALAGGQGAIVDCLLLSNALVSNGDFASALPIIDDLRSQAAQLCFENSDANASMFLVVSHLCVCILVSRV
eukprot:TRINITY_DN2364_c0_g2_i2.p1 TRINITY_DN2364_c0_g2~~TRINITY_DN2364_c0_g2_i2.p1  ORF type:complete len:181 (+),score=18.59 TRINITY_DN2364_c0_g2_i2:35-544(+)